jgi:hypothetical protein
MRVFASSNSDLAYILEMKKNMEITEGTPEWEQLTAGTPEWLRSRGWPRIENRGGWLVRSYYTWAVPNDEYPDWKDGHRRAHKTVCCPKCRKNSPYQTGIDFPDVPGDSPDGYTIQIYDYECVACGFKWRERDEYIED